MRRSPSGKAVVCKTTIRWFDSNTALQFMKTMTLSEKLKLPKGSFGKFLQEQKEKERIENERLNEVILKIRKSKTF